MEYAQEIEKWLQKTHEVQREQVEVMKQRLQLGQTIERAVNTLQRRLWRSQDQYVFARIVLRYRIPVYYGANQRFGRDLARLICETVKKCDPRSKQLQEKRKELDEIGADAEWFMGALERHEKGEEVQIGRFAARILHKYKH